MADCIIRTIQTSDGTIESRIISVVRELDSLTSPILEDVRCIFPNGCLIDMGRKGYIVGTPVESNFVDTTLPLSSDIHTCIYFTQWIDDE